MNSSHNYAVIKILYRPLLCSALLTLPLFSAEEEALTLPVAITQLQHDDYDKREAASIFLWNNASIQELEKLTKHEEPEVRIRAKILIKSLQTGITPDTPQDVIALVEEFDNADLTRISKSLPSIKD